MFCIEMRVDVLAVSGHLTSVYRSGISVDLAAHLFKGDLALRILLDDARGIWIEFQTFDASVPIAFSTANRRSSNSDAERVLTGEIEAAMAAPL